MLYNNTFWSAWTRMIKLRTFEQSVFCIYRYYNIVCKSFAFDRWSFKHLLTYLTCYFSMTHVILYCMSHVWLAVLESWLAHDIVPTWIVLMCHYITFHVLCTFFYVPLFISIPFIFERTRSLAFFILISPVRYIYDSHNSQKQHSHYSHHQYHSHHSHNSLNLHHQLHSHFSHHSHHSIRSSNNYRIIFDRNWFILDWVKAIARDIQFF